MLIGCIAIVCIAATVLFTANKKQNDVTAETVLDQKTSLEATPESSKTDVLSEEDTSVSAESAYIIDTGKSLDTEHVGLSETEPSSLSENSSTAAVTADVEKADDSSVSARSFTEKELPAIEIPDVEEWEISDSEYQRSEDKAQDSGEQSGEDQAEEGENQDSSESSENETETTEEPTTEPPTKRPPDETIVLPDIPFH